MLDKSIGPVYSDLSVGEHNTTFEQLRPGGRPSLRSIFVNACTPVSFAKISSCMRVGIHRIAATKER